MGGRWWARTTSARRRFLLATAVVSLLAPMACAATGPPFAVVTAARPCAGAAPRATYAHVVVVMMENTSYKQIIGNKAAPYLNNLAHVCGLASNYHGVTYPSLPNYLAVTAGSTFGIRDDKLPAAHRLAAASIFSQTGTSWAALSESMPVNCDRSNAYPYMVKHNAAPYYVPLAKACSKQNTPLPSAPTFTARYTFVTPNMVHDMHDGTIAQGDAWLKAFVPKVINSAGYQSGSTILVITWDTDDRNANNWAPTLVVAPQVKPGTTSAASFNHYSLLRLSEEALGLPLLGGARTAGSMRAAFHL